MSVERSNIFLYHPDYAQVRDMWDAEKNGDIDVVKPRKHDKIEYWWVCPLCGRSFKARPLSIAGKIDKGRVWCSECIKGLNPPKVGESFDDYYPELAKLWDYEKNGIITPKMIRPGSNKKFWWICPGCGKSYLKSPHTQKDSRTGGYCSKCANFRKESRYGTLGESYPELALDWSDKNNLSAYEVNAMSMEKYLWKCHICGEEWETSPYRIIKGGSRCQVCAGNKYKRGFTDLKTKYPDICDVWDYDRNSSKPEDNFFRGIQSTSFWFKCPRCGKSHFKSFKSYTRTGGLCVECAIYSTNLDKGNSLRDRRPDLANQFDEEMNGIRAEDVLANDTKQMWWKCDKGHSFKRSPHQRIRHKDVCPICDGKEVLQGYNDFETCYPELVKYWCYDLNNCLPSEVAKNSSKEVWWECPNCGEVYMARVDDRTRTVGCSNCASGGYVSSEEKELLSEVRSWGVYAEENVEIFSNSRHSVDIYIPDKNIAIEFNGLYWHSDEIVSKDYHYNKFNWCKDIGIKLINVWEDDYNHKRTLVFRVLKRILGVSDEEEINAKTCKTKLISHKESCNFLDENHVQGSTRGSIYVGIFNGVKLIGVGVFDSDNGVDFVLKRYATSCILHNGLSRLLKDFRMNTWCWSVKTIVNNGSLDDVFYEDVGFREIGSIDYDDMFVVKGRRVRNFDSSKFKKVKCIWDAGKTVYEKRWY